MFAVRITDSILLLQVVCSHSAPVDSKHCMWGMTVIVHSCTVASNAVILAQYGTVVTAGGGFPDLEAAHRERALRLRSSV